MPGAAKAADGLRAGRRCVGQLHCPPPVYTCVACEDQHLAASELSGEEGAI